MPKQITVTVVFFETAGKKKFVSETPRRSDNTILPMYNDNIEEARQYEDEADAQSHIDRYHNPHCRQFKTMPHQVIQRRKKLFMREEKEEEELC